MQRNVGLERGGTFPRKRRHAQNVAHTQPAAFQSELCAVLLSRRGVVDPMRTMRLLRGILLLRVLHAVQRRRNSSPGEKARQQHPSQK